MSRESLIRYLPDIAFALLFGGGLVVGGDVALAGIPRLVDAVTPAPPVAAKPDTAQDVARFAIPGGFAQSHFAPQVLYPVATPPKPDWLVEAVRTARSAPPAGLHGAGPVIAICIDDLGEDLAGTDKALALPKDVALSFLPYPDATPFLAEAAGRRGHLVLAHVPMQALNGADPGPMGLKPGMPAAEIAGRLG